MLLAFLSVLGRPLLCPAGFSGPPGSALGGPGPARPGAARTSAWCWARASASPFRRARAVRAVWGSCPVPVSLLESPAAPGCPHPVPFVCPRFLPRRPSRLFFLPVPQKKPAAKGGKKKKQVLKFTLDCTHPVEDGIMDAANFVSAGAARGLQRVSPVLLLLLCTPRAARSLSAGRWWRFIAASQLAAKACAYL